MFSSLSGNFSDVSSWIQESSKQAADAVTKGVNELNQGINGMMKENEGEKKNQEPNESGEGDGAAETKNEANEVLTQVSAKLMSDVSSAWGNALAFGKTAMEKVEQNELVKQATATVTDVAQKSVKIVENAPLIKDFNDEQAKFISENKSSSSAHTPWAGYKKEEELKDQILQLSKDKRNFLRAPPAGALFEFDYKQSQPMALALLEVDPNLKDMRFQLVPKVAKEVDFWRNYFYRVSLIKQNAEPIEIVESQSPKEESVTSDGEDLNLDEEFASEEVGTKTDEEAIPQWEKDLQDELQEYEVVEGEDENGEWEKELEDMLGAGPEETSPSDSKPQAEGA